MAPTTPKAPDLSKMTREEKLLFMDALDEFARRELKKKSPYKPHPGQLKAHLSAATERFISSGNGWGKSAFLVNECLAAANGVNPWTGIKTHVPTRIAVVLDSPQKVEETWLPEIRKWYDLKPEQCSKGGKPYISSIVFPNGSEIVFYFFQQEAMIFESVEVEYVFADEPLPRPIYIALFIRGSRTKGTKPRLLQAGTPLAQSWIRKEIIEPWQKGEFKPDEVECFKGSSYENAANLADGYLERFSARLSEKEKAIRISGEHYDLSGLALAHLWDRKTHVVDALEADRIAQRFKTEKFACVIAVDPHPSKPSCAVLVGQDDSRQAYVIDEFRLKATARGFAAELRDWMTTYRVVDIVVDSLGSSDMTGGEGFKSFIEVLKECGIRCRATTYDEKSDEAFVDRIQEALVIEGANPPKLKVLGHCIGSIGDIENVGWQTMKTPDGTGIRPKLLISNTDYLACIKYALAAGAASRTLGRGKVINTAKGSVNIMQRQKR